MKKFENPEMNVEALCVEDIITTSGCELEVECTSKTEEEEI